MAAALDQTLEDGVLILRPHGPWVIEDARRLDAALAEATARLDRGAGRLRIDLSGTTALDTAGAFLLARLENAWEAEGGEVVWHGVGPDRQALLERVRRTLQTEYVPRPEPRENVLGLVGSSVLEVGRDGYGLLTMLGAVVREGLASLVRPSTFRGRAVVRQMELAGLQAVPIILLMSFLIGGIVAQQGAFQLRFFGAEIFTVDLVGILSLREVALLLTAIMVAGRSGSAITAELGSMQMREEIDALKVIGLDPVNVLVLPRVIALILVLPLLTFLAGIANLVGAMLTLWVYSGIAPEIFIERLRGAVAFNTFFSGLIKAPFMALIIGMIACAEGMAVRGSAEALGRHTTASVVKAIFMVIVVDGLFAIFYAAINY
ncbi:MAG TPA: MlaE family lipid ABC transporter permease subunit [Afifellaceae bacterium]|nr:MlaE family lipid ABC transporter permease subunit [Afifellaceae bacterium]